MHLDITKAQALQEYLQAKGWLKENEPIFSLEIPGEGNMNYTLRVRTHDRTPVSYTHLDVYKRQTWHFKQLLARLKIPILGTVSHNVFGQSRA